ncbi:MAG: amidohydrolase family protein [Saprospiraceae bacterium]
MKRTIQLIAGLALILFAHAASAQETFPYNGIKDQREGWYAITHATLIPQAGKQVDNATLVIKNGRIISVTSGGKVPDGAVEIDATGKYVYPSFIDMYAEYGLPKARPAGEGGRMQPQMLSNKNGAYAWNEALKPEFRAHEVFQPDTKAAKNWRSMGFGLVSTHQMDGLSRGTSAVVSVADDRPHEVILKSQAGHYLSFRKGVSTQSYPTSLMGAIALLRQTYLDADWFAKTAGEQNFSLAQWNEVQKLPQIFAVEDWQEALRADKLGDEFGRQYLIKGAGDEYQRVDKIKQTGATFIVPLRFPDAYDVSDPYDAHRLSLAQLRHWEMAPANAALLAKEGVPFVLTADGHSKPSDFIAALRKAIQHGLSEADALRALTETPATLLGVQQDAGTLSVGKWANFLITSGEIFAEGAKIHHNWVQGKPYVVTAIPQWNLQGEYALKAGSRAYNLSIGRKGSTVAIDDSTRLDATVKEEGGLVSISFPQDKGGNLVRLTGVITEGNWYGRGQDADGQWIQWEATSSGQATDDKKAKRLLPLRPLPHPSTPATYPIPLAHLVGNSCPQPRQSLSEMPL